MKLNVLFVRIGQAKLNNKVKRVSEFYFFVMMFNVYLYYSDFSTMLPVFLIINYLFSISKLKYVFFYLKEGDKLKTTETKLTIITPEGKMFRHCKQCIQ